MITVQKYHTDAESVWNEFARTARNGHFMFDRRFMEYHSHRFDDHSLLMFAEQQLVAVLPANLDGDRLISHQGLTFGGFLTSPKTSQVQMLACLDAVLEYSRSHQFSEFIYRAIPYIYSRVPAQEDLYALFRHNAQLFRRDVTSAIDLATRPAYRTLKKRGIKKAIKSGIEVREAPLGQFWPILEQVLKQRHDTQPTHSLPEIQSLAAQFPEHIQCWCGFLEDQPVAGLVMFLSAGVAHTQYIASAESGRDSCAIDYVTDHTIEYYQQEGFRFFNFGISTEQDGHWLNEGLIFHKEGFGARSICHDHYRLPL